MFTTPILAGAPSGKPESLRIMIYGDGSGHKLSLRLNDSTDERFVAAVGPVNWRGWKAIEVSRPESWSHVLGNNDGVFEGPVRTVGVQLDYVAGGPSAGAPYIDDIVLAYGQGSMFKVADFEIRTRKLRTWMLGQTGTTMVIGNGLGPDLLQPVPYALARGSGQSAHFITLLEPFAAEPAVDSFREVHHGVFEIAGKGWTDRVDLSAAQMTYQRTSQLVIPRLVSSPQEWTGLAFVNASDRPAEVACTAYDDQGNPLRGPMVTNPRILSLRSGEKSAALGSEIFGFSTDGPERGGWRGRT